MILTLTVIVLGAIAIISALLLYVVSKKFEVQEDPRIGAVAEVLPQANCGGCGDPGGGGVWSGWGGGEKALPTHTPPPQYKSIHRHYPGGTQHHVPHLGYGAR